MGVQTLIAANYALYVWSVSVSGATSVTANSWPVGGNNWGTSADVTVGVHAVKGATYPNFYTGSMNIALPVPSFTYSGTGTVNNFAVTTMGTGGGATCRRSVSDTTKMTISPSGHRKLL